MSQKYQRYTLKTKESKQILTKISEKLKFSLDDLADPKASVEIVEADFGGLLLLDGKPLLFKTGEMIFPTLMAEAIVARLPKAVVDMGAVRFVCNGADIMAPGVVRYEGEFEKGDVIVVVDVKHGKSLALGEALYSSADARAVKQGPVVKSRHYVSDKVWNFAKSATE
jgi:PUA domain protein